MLWFLMFFKLLSILLIIKLLLSNIFWMENWRPRVKIFYYKVLEVIFINFFSTSLHFFSLQINKFIVILTQAKGKQKSRKKLLRVEWRHLSRAKVWTKAWTSRSKVSNSRIAYHRSRGIDFDLSQNRKRDFFLWGGKPWKNTLV